MSIILPSSHVNRLEVPPLPSGSSVSSAGSWLCFPSSHSLLPAVLLWGVVLFSLRGALWGVVSSLSQSVICILDRKRAQRYRGHQHTQELFQAFSWLFLIRKAGRFQRLVRLTAVKQVHFEMISSLAEARRDEGPLEPCVFLFPRFLTNSSKPTNKP